MAITSARRIWSMWRAMMEPQYLSRALLRFLAPSPFHVAVVATRSPFAAPRTRTWRRAGAASASRSGRPRQERPPDTTRGFGCGAHARRTTAIPGPKSPATQRPGHDALMPHPRASALPRSRRTPAPPPSHSSRHCHARHRLRLHRAGRRPEPTLPPPETSICVNSPTLSVDRPVVVMVTSDRRAINDPGRPRPLYAGHHVARPPPGDEHPQFGDDPERSRRPPHRRASRRARSGTSPRRGTRAAGRPSRG